MLRQKISSNSFFNPLEARGQTRMYGGVKGGGSPLPIDYYLDLIGLTHMFSQINPYKVLFVRSSMVGTEGPTFFPVLEPPKKMLAACRKKLKRLHIDILVKDMCQTEYNRE